MRVVATVTLFDQVPCVVVTSVCLFELNTDARQIRAHFEKRQLSRLNRADSLCILKCDMLNRASHVWELSPSESIPCFACLTCLKCSVCPSIKHEKFNNWGIKLRIQKKPLSFFQMCYACRKMTSKQKRARRNVIHGQTEKRNVNIRTKRASRTHFLYNETWPAKQTERKQTFADRKERMKSRALPKCVFQHIEKRRLNRAYMLFIFRSPETP